MGIQTFRELLETFKGYVKVIRVAKLGWIILHGNIQHLKCQSTSLRATIG